jgi:hypothetical protein
MLRPSLLISLAGFVVADTAVAVPQGQTGPSARYGHTMAYDSVRQCVVMFGGNSNGQWPGGSLGDTWEWNGTTWLQQSPTASPSPRGHGPLTYDSARGVCVMFGGYDGTALGETWEWNGTDWTQRNPAASPAARYHHAMVFDSLRNRTVLFGGNALSNLGDTWEYDGQSWTERVPVSAPSARHHHGMAFDSQRGVTVLFGGHDGTTETSDTWEWNGANWSQRSSLNSPSPRSCPGMTFDGQRNRVVLFGGWSGSFFGDTWEWDGIAWGQSATANSPSPRQEWESALAYDTARGSTFLFGGWDSGGVLGDQWSYDGTDWRPSLNYIRSPINGNLYAATPPMTWAQAEALAVQEGGHLATIRSAQENNWLVQTFGSDEFYIGFNDLATEGLWVWSSGEPVSFTNWNPGEPSNTNNEDCGVVEPIWSGRWNDGSSAGPAIAVIELPGGPTAPITFTSSPTTATPPAVTGHALAPLPTGGEVLFGGTTGTSPQPFTYELQNGSWTKQFSLLNPMVRTDHSLMLDPVRQNNLLFGGRNPLGTAINDTWTWANGSWTYLPQATAPSPRSGHRMTFDSVANLGLLFGGKDASGAAIGDFWSWNGTAWSPLNPAALPPARFAHGLAFDSYRSRTVLFGGADSNGRRDDVWEWNGADWAQISPTAGTGGPWIPDPRQDFGMAYDPRAERVVVHGGEANGCMGDAWSWDGASWTLHTPTGSAPTPRSGEQLLLDPTTNQLILFGGGCGANLTNDLWTLDLPTFWRWSSYGAGCVGSRGIPALSVASGSTAILGQTLQLELANVPAFFSSSFGVLGFNRTTFLGQPLPFDLGFFGLTGCFSWTSADNSYPMSAPNAQGVSSWSMALPNAPFLLGFELNLQALSFEVPGFSRWASVSNGLIVRCGNR